MRGKKLSDLVGHTRFEPASTAVQAAERKAASEFDSSDQAADLEQSLDRINSLALQLVPRFEATCQ